MGLLRPGPGIVGMAARTAVVAGTATAVSGRVARRQQQKYEQSQPAPAPAPAPAAPAPGGGEDDVVEKLQQLASLHSSGVLSDEEFEAAKAKLLA